ncbi:MAG TPA: phosphatase PAP2 family protein [Myxococcaceae bacterium]|nr:phosphatase PAP2 family protein [Myxococcaceae bacterium]
MGLDRWLVWWVIHLEERHPLLGKIAVAVYADTLKTGVFAALIFFVWFGRSDPEQARDSREKLSAGLLVGLAGVALVRVLAAVLPFRDRPLVALEFAGRFPLAINGWGSWSSFPSDHALLFLALSVAILSVSRPLGLVALLDAVVFICGSRLAVGVHYPSDLLVGGAMGVGATLFALQPRVRGTVSAPALRWLERSAPSFYACFFLLNYLLAQAFWPVVRLLVLLRRVV